MQSLDYPELEWRPVELPETHAVFRGPAGGALTDRLRFGGPVAVPLDVDDVHDDPDLVTFIAKQSGTARYTLLHCGLSFHRSQGEPELATAAVQLSFHVDGVGDGERPIAWSLAPMAAGTAVETTSSFSLGPDAKILGASIKLGTVGRESTRHREDVFLQATGLLTSEPGWEFTRTPANELSGSHRLVMVIRAAATSRARAVVTLSASVRAGAWPRRFRRSAPLDGGTEADLAVVF
jgi:hypothetical protein